MIALSASAFRADSQVASAGDRVYVLLPKIGAAAAVTSWARGVVAALRRELGLDVRAVTAAPLTGLAAAAAARAEVDRVFDSAERHPGAIGQVTSLDEARTTVLLDEIVSHVAAEPRLVDPRVRELCAQEPMLADTLRAYLDGFGDIADDRAAAARPPQHRALPHPPDREAAGDLAGMTPTSAWCSRSGCGPPSPERIGRESDRHGGQRAQSANRCTAAAMRSSVAVNATRTCRAPRGP